jgi:hypothetical protein
MVMVKDIKWFFNRLGEEGDFSDADMTRLTSLLQDATRDGRDAFEPIDDHSASKMNDFWMTQPQYLMEAVQRTFLIGVGMGMAIQEEKANESAPDAGS